MDVIRICLLSRLPRPGMGDLVQRNILLSLLRQAHPHARVSWVLGADVRQAPASAELARRHSYAHEVAFCPALDDDDGRAWARFLDWLARQRFDVGVVDPGGLRLGAHELRAAGVPCRIAVNAPGSGGSVTHPLRLPWPTWDRNDLYDYAAGLAGALGVAVPPVAAVLPRLPFRPEPVPELPAGPVVGLHPAGARSWHRRWPLARFGELAMRLAGRGAAVVLLGGADEEAEVTAIAAEVAGRCPGAVLRLSVGEPLNRVANLIDRMDLLVGNNSGPAHLAAALSTPTVVIYGPDGGDLWARAYPLHRAVDRHHPCQRRRNEDTEWDGQCALGCPCEYTSADGRYPACLTDVGVAEVWQAVLDQLPVLDQLQVLDRLPVRDGRPR